MKSKIKQANQKWKHEQKRRKKAYQQKLKRDAIKIQRNKARKLYRQGEKEFYRRKALEVDYVNNLATEVENESIRN